MMLWEASVQSLDPKCAVFTPAAAAPGLASSGSSGSVHHAVFILLQINYCPLSHWNILPRYRPVSSVQLSPAAQK